MTPASFLHPILGGRLPRFDPTAFVKAKEKRLREIKMKLASISSSLAHISAPLLGPLICPHLPSVSITCHLLHLSPSLM